MHFPSDTTEVRSSSSTHRSPPKPLRFDLAHQLGHLLLHGGSLFECDTKLRERQANDFASAFLMPRGRPTWLTARKRITRRLAETSGHLEGQRDGDHRTPPSTTSGLRLDLPAHVSGTIETRLPTRRAWFNSRTGVVQLVGSDPRRPTRTKPRLSLPCQYHPRAHS